jgi:hypothetical protein
MPKHFVITQNIFLSYLFNMCLHDLYVIIKFKQMVLLSNFEG